MGYGNYGFVTESAFNRFVNLDNVEWHIIDYLAKSKSKYADYLWKILKYDTEDCLSQPSLTYEEKMALVYTTNGDATPYRVFMSPYIDDAWEEQSSHLHLYVDTMTPKDHISAVVNIRFECIVHNKISNIIGDASRFNDKSNPSEIHNNEVTTPYKNRATVMLKCVLAELNGVFVNGVGVLQFNSTLSPYSNSRMSLWNSRKFYGHSFAMSTLMAGDSSESNCGY